MLDSGLMIFSSPGAIFLKIGPLTIRWYGVMIALGFVVATLAARRICKLWELDPEKVINCALVVFICGILGARLYFVALNLTYYIPRPLEILATWNGGLSIHGAILGGFIAGALYCYKNHLPVPELAAVFGTVTPLGQAIGRWGNFFNSEAFGLPVPSNFPLQLYIPPDKRPEQYINANYFHPTFLYESLWDLCVFILLYAFLSRRLRSHPMAIFFMYLLFYSAGRLWIEPMRTDSIMSFGMPVPIIASVVTVVISVIALIIVVLKKKGIRTS